MNGLKLARKQANESEFKRAPTGAIITKGGRVLSTGFNKKRRSKYSARPMYESIHAEEDAILKVLRRPDGLKHLAGATIYITRILKDGTTGLAKPCKHCQNLINSVGIKKVIHT
jgi:deoxycytidylate deaminase